MAMKPKGCAPLIHMPHVMESPTGEVNVGMAGCCRNCATQQNGHLRPKHFASESDMVVAFEPVKIVMGTKTCRLYDKVD